MLHWIVFTSSLILFYIPFSISMIVVQLMLLHAIMLKHRQSLKRQSKWLSDGPKNMGFDSTDSLLSYSMTGGSPTHSNHNKSFLQALSRSVALHFQHLCSPHNILHEHNFLEYFELLFISSMAVKLVFDYHWYPNYGMACVLALKNTSIVLESCLALPQAWRNYRKGSTEGLSLVMVGGWLAGDIFKLIYFLCNMIKSGGDHSNLAFVLGCIFSVSMDSVVGMQMAGSNPEAKKWLHRIKSSLRHWKANKDDDAGESLLVNNVPKQDGLCASILRAFFHWARDLRRPASNAS